MNNNDILRRLRYTFHLPDGKMQDIFSKGNVVVSTKTVINYLRKEDDPERENLIDFQLASFLNGWIIDLRGQKDDKVPLAEKKLNNNLIFRKIRIALSLKDEDILGILQEADFKFSKSELNALFRKKDHAQFRVCKDQVLRYFMMGLQLRYRKK